MGRETLGTLGFKFSALASPQAGPPASEHSREAALPPARLRPGEFTTEHNAGGFAAVPAFPRSSCPAELDRGDVAEDHNDAPRRCACSECASVRVRIR